MYTLAPTPHSRTALAVYTLCREGGAARHQAAGVRQVQGQVGQDKQHYPAGALQRVRQTSPLLYCHLATKCARIACVCVCVCVCVCGLRTRRVPPPISTGFCFDSPPSMRVFHPAFVFVTAFVATAGATCRYMQVRDNPRFGEANTKMAKMISRALRVKVSDVEITSGFGSEETKWVRWCRPAMRRVAVPLQSHGAMVLCHAMPRAACVCACPHHVVQGGTGWFACAFLCSRSRSRSRSCA